MGGGEDSLSEKTFQKHKPEVAKINLWVIAYKEKSFTLTFEKKKLIFLIVDSLCFC